ncbi:hypothetical protein FQR65_LT14578 [Abscondita terminalis]|nr:hypothetical protein FQR65_LT14578 [Abscondita terminalis]
MSSNYQLFKIELDTIPIFDGSETQINAFCMACENVYQRYKSVIELIELNTVIRAAIFSKFKGKACEILSPRDDLNVRHLEQLTIEFNNIKSNENENIVEYGHRIRSALGKLIAKLILSDLPHKNIRQELLITNALDRYLVTIPYQISMQIRTRQPETLEQAVTYAQDEVNFAQRSGQNINTFTSRIAPSKPITQNPFQKFSPNFKPPQQTVRPPFQSNFKNFNQASPPNFNQNQLNFNRNQTQFNKPPSNVFKPNQNFNLPKPTPMSGISTVRNYLQETNPESFIYDEETNQYYAPVHVDQLNDNSNEQNFSSNIETDVTESEINFSEATSTTELR